MIERIGQAMLEFVLIGCIVLLSLVICLIIILICMRRKRKVRKATSSLFSDEDGYWREDPESARKCDRAQSVQFETKVLDSFTGDMKKPNDMRDIYDIPGLAPVEDDDANMFDFNADIPSLTPSIGSHKQLNESTTVRPSVVASSNVHDSVQAKVIETWVRQAAERSQAISKVGVRTRGKNRWMDAMRTRELFAVPDRIFSGPRERKNQHVAAKMIKYPKLKLMESYPKVVKLERRQQPSLPLALQSKKKIRKIKAKPKKLKVIKNKKKVQKN